MTPNRLTGCPDRSDRLPDRLPDRNRLPPRQDPSALNDQIRGPCNDAARELGSDRRIDSAAESGPSGPWFFGVFLEGLYDLVGSLH